MCGRFACYSCGPDLRSKLIKSNVEVADKWQDEDKFYPRYNMAPRGWVPVIRRNEQNELIIQSMRWGFIPFWAKKMPDVQPINARDETLMAEKSIFDSAKQRKRCIVVADGFYEWKKLGDGKKKIPHFVKRKDGKLMLFAGLYDTFEEEDNVVYTCAIITTTASPFFSSIHDRMPVIFENGSESVQSWLDQSQGWNDKLNCSGKSNPNKETIGMSVKTRIYSYQVTDRVGPTKNNSPDFVVPVDQLKGSIASFFKKPESATPKRPAEEQKEQISESKKKKTE
ncbi:hypothetical protein EC973_003165 [Apophysomyces ossiformis]|uniref:DUF159-domain-containing protein n=1 Tax=Apophysomyces ossiformis TaxID=679940 RepID=A0A8H7BLQ7_9FUNG|nr:hypothetical protein EC973_003165 [Apophysomyces ossiformis]